MPSKTHPKSKKAQTMLREFGIEDDGLLFTVWKKSLVFQCNGFTVFDGEGKLAFRVDNYHSSPINEVLLMDAHGNSLLTMTRKRFSLHNEWQAFSGDKSNGEPLCRVRRPCLCLPSKASLAEIFVGSRIGRHPQYRIEGSFAKRCCTIYNSSNHIVAELRRKKVSSEITLGGDVFDVRVQRGSDPTFAMGVIVILDQMIADPKKEDDGINFRFPSSSWWARASG